MKKSLYLLLIFLFCAPLLKSQHLSTVWVKHWGGTSNDFFKQNLIDSDGNIIVVAGALNTYIDTFYVNGNFFAKLTQDGNVLLVENHDTSYNYWNLFSQRSNNNEIILYSNIYSDFNNTVFELAKYNSLGQKLWGKIFTKPNNHYLDFSKNISLEICSDDYIHLALYIHALYFVMPSGDTIFLNQNNKNNIFKFDQDGNLISIFNPSTNNRIEDFKLNNSNNPLLLSGLFNNSSMLAKYDINYNYLLQVGVIDFYAEKFFLDDSNNVYMPHVTSQSLFGYTNESNLPKEHLYVAKYNENNTLSWAKKFYGHIDSFPHPILPHIPIALKTHFGNINMTVNQNDVYVYGLFKYKFSISTNDYFSADSSKMSYFISKFDKQGNYHWTEIFNASEPVYTDHSTSFYKTMDLKVLDDGTLLCGLWFNNYIEVGDSLYQSRGGWDMLIMRLEETGVGIAPVAANDDWGFRVYPNPAQNEITLQFNSGFQTQELFIEIFDITGRQVLNRHYQNPSQTMGMDISMLGKGMYFIRAHTGTNSKVEKILVY